MSADDYALHISQKYRLAISLAILKTKPDNSSINEHLNKIRNDFNENTDDELNVSACSDDFNINDDDKDQNCMNQNRLSSDINSIGKLTDSSIKTNINIGSNNFGNNNDTKDIEHVTKVNKNGAIVNNGTKVNGNIIRVSGDALNNGAGALVNAERTDILRNGNRTELAETETQDLGNSSKEACEDEVNKYTKNTFREIIQLMKGVDVTAADEVIFNKNARPFCVNYKKPFVEDLTQCDEDNDNTISLSIDILTEEYRRSGFEHNYSQSNIESTTENVNDTAKQIYTSNSNIALTTENNNIKHNAKLNKRTNPTKESASKPKIAKKINKKAKKDLNIMMVENTNLNKGTTNTSNETNNSLKIQSNRDAIKTAEGLTINTQETIVNTQPEYTQFCTHYSESQMKEIDIDSKLLYGKPKTVINNDITTIVNNEMEFLAQNSKRRYEIFEPVKILTQNNINHSPSTDIMNEWPNRESDVCYNVIENNTALSINTQTNDPRYFGPIKNAIEKVPAFSENAQNMQNYIDLKINKNTEKDYTNIDKTTDNKNKNHQDIDKNLVTCDKNDCTVFNETNNDSINNNGNPNDTDDFYDLTDTDIEKIPFKIIKEMNNVKMYVDKGFDKMEFSSGYTSLQSRCSYKSSQITSVRIEQSGYCIFNYISSCSLISSTQDLTEQISEVLGQLIDRLHEEETYPPFLEELLTTVEELLKLVYEEENYEFDMLLKKDEHIQRIILLNKSTHIQKFTIEKINNILQQLFDEISADSTDNEIKNINKMENICYIFHILRVILSKYNNYSSTQTSQESEKTLRKSDITDLWRKKWIPKFKETSIESSSENKCALKDCSSILNKIIVSSMDGYSLIAYSALQCFNMMQS